MDRTIKSAETTGSHWTIEDIKHCIDDASVVVFAKGNPEHPRCGFSEKLFVEMERTGQPYRIVDVCQDPSAAPALKAFNGQQYLPAVYVNGELVGSSQNLSQMLSNGVLAERVRSVEPAKNARK